MFQVALRAFKQPLALRNPRILPLSSTRITQVSIRSMSSFGESTLRPKPDAVLQDIADYVHDYKVSTDLAWETARLCLIDTVGCGLEGLRFPECARLMGPVVPGTIVPNGNALLDAAFIRSNRATCSQEQKSPGQISSSILFEVLST